MTIRLKKLVGSTKGIISSETSMSGGKKGGEALLKQTNLEVRNSYADKVPAKPVGSCARKGQVKTK